MKSRSSLINTLALCMISSISVAQTTGSLKGKIIGQSTKQPIIGVSVHIDNTQLGATTDTTGVFAINGLPVGTYSVTISSVGFQTKNISEIIIAPNKTYYSEIELLEAASNLNEVVVRSFKGENNPLTPVSAYSYSREEIFRNPGAQGDIMRALSSFPGVVSSGAQFSAFVDLANINNQFNTNSEIFLPETGKVYNIGLGVFPTFGVRVEL